MLLTAFFKKLCPDLETVSKSVRMMKIVTLFLFVGSMQLAARTAAQGISLSLNNAAFSVAFTVIEQQTTYHFIYTNEQLSTTSKITLTVQNASIEKVLELCFKDQPLTWSIEDRFIIVKIKERKIIAVTTVDNEVRGRVSNEKDEPIAGATISLKTNKRATTTDNKGEFVLADVPAGSVIVISNVGFELREITIGNNRYLNIHLNTVVSALDEMVIKGYYSTSKRLNTGNVSKIGAADIEKQAVSNPLQAIQGRMPGIYISQSTGLPGAAFAVNIRGRNSIASGNDPFYIIDGVPFTSASLASTYTSFSTLGGNPLSGINPTDIESIEILKDADATAIYGSRAANGVILITTKKGKSGKTIADININAGWGKVSKMLPLLNTQQYLNMRHEAFTNDGKIPTADNAPDLLLWDTTRNTDWQKQAYGKTAHFSDVQASLSGGSAHMQFLVGTAYHRESTVFGNDFADRKGSVHLKITNLSTDQKFKITVSANYIVDNNYLPLVDISKRILNLPPDAPPIYKPDGSLNWENKFNNPFSSFLSRYKINTENLISNAQLSYQLLPGLSVKTNLGFTEMNTHETATVPTTAFDPAYNLASGYADFANASLKSWIIEPQLQYQFRMQQKNNFSFLLGGSFQENIRQGLTQEGYGFSNNALLENIAAASTITLINSNYTQYKYNALFGRLNYNRLDKYLINITARRDGSSRFGPGKQFANFAAVGVGWIFTKEHFFQRNAPSLSFGKIRASYGSSGNDQIADYGYLSLWQPAAYPYQGNSGLTPSRLSNANYGWERNRKLELAIELGMLKDRLLINLSYYRNRAGNQLVGYPLPLITGQSSVQANLPALIQNAGFEGELSYHVLRSAIFNWKMSFNITVARNRLLEYPGLEISNFKNQYVLGRSLYIRKLFHVTGVSSQSGIYQFQDLNGNGVGTDYPADLQDTRELTQKYFGGFSNSFQFKKFKLDILFQFVKQQGVNYMYNSFNVPGTMGNQPEYVLDRWQKPGDKSGIQRFTEDYTTAYDTYSTATSLGDAFISDASFIRLRNIYLSWDAGGKWTQKMRMINLSIYLSGQNVLTFTNYRGTDPENQIPTAIPPLRIVSAGIKLTL